MLQRLTRYGVPVLLAMAALILLFREYQSSLDTERRLLTQRGQTILESLAAGIRVQTWMNRYQIDRLDHFLWAQIEESPDILALALSEESQHWILRAGDETFLPDAPKRPGVFWQGSSVLLCVTVSFRGPGPGLGPGPGPGRRGQAGPGWGPGPDQGRRMGRIDAPFPGEGRGRRPPDNLDSADWTDWGNAPIMLSVVLDTGFLQQTQRRAALRFVLSFATLAALMTLILWAIQNNNRRQKLIEELILERERAAHGEQLARLAAGLAHETKNPLGLVRGLAQSLCDAETASPDLRASLTRIIDETDRVAGQLDGFLALAKPVQPVLAEVDLSELVRDLLELMRQEAGERRITLDIEGDPAVVHADRDLLRRALLNLLLNAIQACDAGDRITVRIQPEAEQGLNLSVKDTGRGIPMGDLPHVTMPYFSTTPGGTGLGLAIVSEIARAHGWRLDLRSYPGEGTEVTLAGLDTLR